MDYHLPQFVNKIDAAMVYGSPPLTYLYRYTFKLNKLTIKVLSKYCGCFFMLSKILLIIVP